jgi:hypothetical protein
MVAPVVVSDRVTVCADAYVPDATEKVGVAATGIPVPVSVTVWLAPLTRPELSTMVIVAVRVPVAFGVKVTLRVQAAPAATLDPQGLVSE